MAEFSADVLGLQDYAVRDTHRLSETEEEVTVELPLSSRCPKCQTETNLIHQRACRQSRVLWSFINGRRIWLLVRRQRLRCSSCRKVFTQPLPGVARRQRMSLVAQTSTVQALAEQSFASVRRTHGISYGRARRILLRLPVPWCDWDTLLGQKGEVLLGIDEHSFRGKDLVITITCLTTRRLVAILQNDRQKTLRDWLLNVPEEFRQRVVAVAIDLKAAFRKVINKMLPNAVVVADRFHLIQDANRRIEETRRLEQSEARRVIPRWPLIKGRERLTPKQQVKLELLKAEFPALAEQHRLKEELRDLYSCQDAKTAKEHLDKLVLNGEASDDASTVLWMNTLRDWRTEILAYFKHRITNAFTEGCHTKVKLQKRLSYGFRNVQVYIRKMLLGFQPHTHDRLVSHLLT